MTKTKTGCAWAASLLLQFLPSKLWAYNIFDNIGDGTMSFLKRGLTGHFNALAFKASVARIFETSLAWSPLAVLLLVVLFFVYSRSKAGKERIKIMKLEFSPKEGYEKIKFLPDFTELPASCVFYYYFETNSLGELSERINALPELDNLQFQLDIAYMLMKKGEYLIKDQWLVYPNLTGKQIAALTKMITERNEEEVKRCLSLPGINPELEIALFEAEAEKKEEEEENEIKYSSVQMPPVINKTEVNKIKNFSYNDAEEDKAVPVPAKNDSVAFEKSDDFSAGGQDSPYTPAPGFAATAAYKNGGAEQKVEVIGGSFKKAEKSQAKTGAALPDSMSRIAAALIKNKKS